MKNITHLVLILLVVLIGVFSCNKQSQSVNITSDSLTSLYQELDEVKNINIELFANYKQLADSVSVLKDSLEKLNKKPLMDEKLFIKVYKYETLLRYYQICKKNPSQWVYYRGWSTRVFEER